MMAIPRFCREADRMTKYNEKQKAGRYLLELIRAGLHARKAMEKPDDITWEQIWDLAKKNRVESMSAYGVKTLQNQPPKEIAKLWCYSIEYAIYQTLRMATEREKIRKRMEEENLRYIFLKGIHIQDYYPQAGMRTMADNDILYGLDTPDKKESSDIVKCIMLERGYQQIEQGEVHDIYIKKPNYRFEMHKQLVSKRTEFYEYYQDPWKYTIPEGLHKGEYRFRKEDEWIYVLVHGYMHFSRSGCGIRLLADIYVLMEKYKDSMDYNYIEQELKKLQLTDFAGMIVSTAKKAFDLQMEAFSMQEDELLDEMLLAGAYGSFEVLLKNRGQNRWQYAWKRIFPDRQWWEIYYPVCKEHPWMYPLCWLYRMTAGMYKKRRKVMSFFREKRE